jgi:hypothetical protein
MRDWRLINVGCLWPRPGFVGLPEVEMSPTSKEIFVDSHQHFWDPRALSWPAPTNPIFHRAFLPADLLQEIDPVRGGPHGTGTGISANRWFFATANAADHVRGVVAWIDLLDPTSCRQFPGRIATRAEVRGDQAHSDRRTRRLDDPLTRSREFQRVGTTRRCF